MKKPSKPTTAYLDMDMLLFSAASAGEKVQYIYSDSDGNEVSRFDSAEAGKNWITEIESFGVDFTFNYDGDIDDLVRSVEYLDLGEEKAIEAFDKMLKADLKACNTPKWKGFVSGATGAANFRHKLATIKEYKGQRKGLRKPKYLEAVRKHALTYKEVTSPPSWIEVDDIAQAMAQRAGEKGLAYGGDKDNLTSVGCWIYNYSYFDEAIFSDPTTVGYLEMRSDGKLIGCGWIYLMHQALTGDSADGIAGCKGWAEKKVFPLLSPYNHKPISELPDLLLEVAKVYKSVYGEEYKYKHWDTKEEITASWYDILHENLQCLYMLKDTKDSAEKSVLKYLKKEDV